MRKSTSSSERSLPADIELAEMFPRLVMQAFEKGDITVDVRDFYLSKPLDTMDDLEECYNDFRQVIDNKEYYKLIARLEKADEVIEAEQDQRKKEYYILKRQELIQNLERMRPA